MGQMIPEVILKHTLHKLSTTLITYLKVTYLMNSPIYNPESRKYQESLLTRKMGIIQIVIKGNRYSPWARPNFNTISDGAEGSKNYPTTYLFKFLI